MKKSFTHKPRSAKWPFFSTPLFARTHTPPAYKQAERRNEAGVSLSMYSTLISPSER